MAKNTPNQTLASYFPNDVVELDPSSVFPLQPDDPRIKAAGLDRMVQSIQQHGQLTPGLVIAFPDGHEREGGYGVIAGLQRLRAIKKANKADGQQRKYRALVANTDLSFADQLIAMAATNEFVTPPTMLERSYAFVRVLEECGGNNSEAARRLGVNEKMIRNATLLTKEATGQLVEAITSNVISETKALEILNQTKGNAKAQIAEVAKINKLAEKKAAEGKEAKTGSNKALVNASDLEPKKPRPNARLIERLMKASGVPAAILTVLQWIVGDLSNDELAVSEKWAGKVFKQFAVEDEAAEAEAEKAREAKKAEAEKTKAEKAAEKAKKDEERRAEKIKKEREKAAEKIKAEQERLAALERGELPTKPKKEKKDEAAESAVPAAPPVKSRFDFDDEEMDDDDDDDFGDDDDDDE